MRIALFSDIHANLPALEAFFEDVEKQKPDAYAARKAGILGFRKAIKTQLPPSPED